MGRVLFLDDVLTPLHGCLSTSFSIMSFQFVTGCHFSDKNKYYYCGGREVAEVPLPLSVSTQTIRYFNGKMLLVKQIFASQYLLLYQA